MDAPKYFLKKKFLMETVAFDTVFSVLFLVIYRPFSSTFWLGATPFSILAMSVIFYVCCIAFMIISKLCLCRKAQERTIGMKQLCWWVLGELAGLSIIYLVCTMITGYASKSSPAELLLRTVSCVAMIMVIPFAFTLLYAIIQDKKEEIRVLKKSIEPEEAAKAPSLINLYDHSGVLKLSVAQDDVFYAESENNYVNIHYLVDSNVESYMLRCPTSDIEKAFKDTAIIRCHRSFLVNLNHIKLMKHSKGRACLILSDNAGTEIPVSRNYYKELLEVLVPDKIVRNN